VRVVIYICTSVQEEYNHIFFLILIWCYHFFIIFFCIFYWTYRCVLCQPCWLPARNWLGRCRIRTRDSQVHYNWATAQCCEIWNKCTSTFMARDILLIFWVGIQYPRIKSQNVNLYKKPTHEIYRYIGSDVSKKYAIYSNCINYWLQEIPVKSYKFHDILYYFECIMLPTKPNRSESFADECRTLLQFMGTTANFAWTSLFSLFSVYHNFRYKMNRMIENWWQTLICNKMEACMHYED